MLRMPRPSRRRLVSPLLAPGLTLLVAANVGCGDVKKKEKERTASSTKEVNKSSKDAIEPDKNVENGPLGDSTGILLFDVKKELKAPGLDMTLTRLRAWKSNPPNASPGALGSVDDHIVEFWYKFPDETVERYARLGATNYAPTDGLTVDADGWVFRKNSPPGAKSYSYETNADGQEDVVTTVSSAPDSLMSVRDLSVPAVIAGARARPDFPWRNLKARIGFNLVNRLLFERNPGNAIKGVRGCQVTPADATGKRLETEYVYVDELVGNLTYDMRVPKNRDPATAPKDVGSPLIAWNHSWQVTGLNLKTKTLRLFHRKSAPLYNARQAPGAFGDVMVPGISATESLIRACNKAARNVGGKFQLFGMGTDPYTIGLTVFGEPLSYCKDFEDAIAAGANAMSLTDYPARCAWIDYRLPVRGTWTGTIHDYEKYTPTSSTNYYSLNYLTDTDVIELKFE